MKMLRISSCLLIALSASAAWAAEDELVEKVVVRNRLFNVAGHFEAGVDFGFSMLSRLTDHYNLSASGSYNFVDTLAVEVRVAYAISRHTGLADKMALDFASTPGLKNSCNPAIPKSCVDDLSDLWQMGFNAIAGIRWQPVYGKISLMAELPVHFQAYLWAGGGVALLHRESLLICKDRLKNCADYSNATLPDGSNNPAFKAAPSPFFEEDKVGPLVSLALGFRFFVTNRHAVKLEFRDYSWLESRYENVNRTEAQGPPTSECPLGRAVAVSTPTGCNGNLVASPGITNLVQIDLGYTFIF